jgi:hypothetical protein
MASKTPDTAGIFVTQVKRDFQSPGTEPSGLASGDPKRCGVNTLWPCAMGYAFDSDGLAAAPRRTDSSVVPGGVWRETCQPWRTTLACVARNFEGRAIPRSAVTPENRLAPECLSGRQLTLEATPLGFHSLSAQSGPDRVRHDARVGCAIAALSLRVGGFRLLGV